MRPYFTLLFNAAGGTTTTFLVSGHESESLFYLKLKVKFLFILN